MYYNVILNIFILGVSVDGFKKEFERKSSLTSSAPAKPKSNVAPKRTLIDKQKSEDDKAEIPVEKQTNKVVNNAHEHKKMDAKSKVSKPETNGEYFSSLRLIINSLWYVSFLGYTGF